MPSHYVRPVRLAAQIAAQRINQISKVDNANSDSDEGSSTLNIQIPDTVLRARARGYDDTVILVKYLLDQSENSQNSEDRVDIANRTFELLIKNPKILIYEPKFRDAVVTKMKEFDAILNKREDGFKNAQYGKAIDMMKLSMMAHITNSKMRNRIYEHLNDITKILNEYNKWSKNSTLRKTFDTLTNTLEIIKTHPNYMASVL
jgi:hypothetical protein